MGRFGSALGLAGGAALVACGLLVIALAPLGAAWSAPAPSGRRRNGDGHDAVGAERQHASGLIGISRGRGNGNGNGNGHGNGNCNGYHIDLGYHPFVSVHVAAYNEKRVIERLLNSLDQLEYPAYEVVLVDDSTDESVQILQQWVGRPKFKILHRNSRQGLKD